MNLDCLSLWCHLMVYNLQSRLAHVGNRMKAVNGSQAIYRRGSETVPITVSPILTEAEEIVPGVSITRIERQDFVFDAALVLGGSAMLPAPGDEILWNNQVFRLVSPGDNEPIYHYTTSARDRIRVSTEQTG